MKLRERIARKVYPAIFDRADSYKRRYRHAWEDHLSRCDHHDSYPLATCSGWPEGSHKRIKVLFPDECAACWGSDDWCEPFCPVCEYCGGC